MVGQLAIAQVAKGSAAGSWCGFTSDESEKVRRTAVERKQAWNLSVKIAHIVGLNNDLWWVGVDANRRLRRGNVHLARGMRCRGVGVGQARASASCR